MVQPGLAAGLARLEVQEKVERQRKPDNRFFMPLDEVLRQLLSECTNYQAAKVLGIPEVAKLQEARERLQVPVPWCSRPKEFTLAAGRVAQRRWAMWQERVPDPISKEELLALIEAEMRKIPVSDESPERLRAVLQRRTKKGVIQIRQERAEALAAAFTPGALLVEVKRWYEERGYFPQVSQLAGALGRSSDLIALRARTLEAQGILDLEKDRLVIPDGVAGGQVIRETWPREKLEEHLLSLGVDPRPGVKRPIKSTEETQPASPATPEEVQTPMDARVAAPDELLPDDPPAPQLPPPVSVPARSGVRRIDWPSDRKLVAEADAILERGGNVTKELCDRFTVKSGALWQRIGDARERLGLPRKMGIKRGGTKADQPPEEIDAPPVKLAEYLCSDCRDTGIVGGGESGPPCDCAEGERVKAAVHGEDEANRPRTVPDFIAQPSSDPREGGSSAEKNPASDAATDAQNGKIVEVEFKGFSETDRPTAELVNRAFDFQEQLNVRARAIARLEDEIRELTAERAKDQVTIQQLTATIEKAMTEASAPVLLLQYKGEVREVPLPEGLTLIKVGDHYAEQVDVDGRRRVAIWECTGTGIVGGRVVCICKLIKAAPQAREAA